ncbi:MAG: MBL fold metallo-hydrolase [Halobacteriaceae archaeon]
MSEMEFPEPDVPVDAVDPETLKDQIDAGESVTVLDVRTPSDFEEWRIEGENVDVTNVPYWDFLDGVTETAAEQVPEEGPVVVICAKGESSKFVAGVLKEEFDVEASNLADGMVGWANLYESVELDADTEATVLQYQRPSSGCLSYLVVSDTGAAVVDPLSAFTDRYEADAAALGAELTHAVDTHIHADHVSGVRDLGEETSAAPVIPEAATDRGVTYADDVATVADGESIPVGDAAIEAVHTPGHTTGMTSYLLDDAVLFTGDGLFVESVARPDLEKGDDGAPDAAALLYESLQERVLSQNDDVLVAPAHFSDAAESRESGAYVETVEDLESRMDALSMPESEFVEYVLSDMPPRPANYEDIIATNLGQNERGDDVLEMELGPNNCAASQDAMTSDD